MLQSLILGTIAASANLLGGIILVHRRWEDRMLRYFIALGAGFMMSVALLDMLPDSLKFSAHWAPLLVLAGYCAIHLVEHTITSHFHLGEETHAVHAHTGISVLVGLSAHAFFDGVAIASGFVISSMLGWLIFGAVILHKIPVGFTVASVMLASGRTRRAALGAALTLALATIAGVLVIALVPHWVYAGLPLSAGVAIYVAASDLIPEVNREPGLGMALVFFLGVGLFLAIRAIAAV
jgi:ZIP family zinc transporter/zinc and cadmium transporter